MNKGFTTIELVIVIVVMGILSYVAVSPSSLNLIDSARINSCADSVKADIYWCQQIAQRSSLWTRIVLSPYAVQIQSAQTWIDANRNLRNNRSLYITSSTLADGVIAFDPRGYPYEPLQTDQPSVAGTHLLTTARQIVLQSTNLAVTKTLTINPPRGYVQIE